ncbi:hypothetical protein [Streptomyces canus]|uniref:hypothetical protein n=1 Tax=Streptomyces canus TaxID=58343 RepID=UPI0034302FFF
MPRRFRYGAYGYEGVTCVVASGSSTSATASGQTLVVARAIKVLLTKLGRCETSSDRNSQSPQATLADLADLADLAAEYATLLSRHAPRHRAMHGRSSRDLKVSGADCQPSTRALIARRNGSTSSPWHRPFRQPATSLLSRSAA